MGGVCGFLGDGAGGGGGVGGGFIVNNEVSDNGTLFKKAITPTFATYTI